LRMTAAMRWPRTGCHGTSCRSMLSSIMARRSLASWVEPTRGQRLCAPDPDQFLRQPDTAVIRTGSVAIFTRFCLRRSIASHGTIAKLVGAAGAARSAAQNL
jgi:hypothetical protein